MGDAHTAGWRRSRELTRSDPITQFVWYLVVGGASFLADLVVLSALLHAGAPLAPALVASFALGTLVNYVLSVLLAFVGGRHRRSGEVFRIFVVSLVGLGLTLILVWGFMALGLSAILSKIAATPIALIWNFLGRRLFVFTSVMPLRTWKMSRQIVALARSAGRAPSRLGTPDA